VVINSLILSLRAQRGNLAFDLSGGNFKTVQNAEKPDCRVAALLAMTDKMSFCEFITSLLRELHAL
jgi:hypothetical protein